MTAFIFSVGCLKWVCFGVHWIFLLGIQCFVTQGIQLGSAHMVQLCCRYESEEWGCNRLALRSQRPRSRVMWPVLTFEEIMWCSGAVVKLMNRWRWHHIFERATRTKPLNTKARTSRCGKISAKQAVSYDSNRAPSK